MYPLGLTDPSSSFGATARAPLEDVLALQSYAVEGLDDGCAYSAVSCVSVNSCFSFPSTIPDIPDPGCISAVSGIYYPVTQPRLD